MYELGRFIPLSPIAHPYRLRPSWPYIVLNNNRNHGVRQGPEIQGVLLALPGQVSPSSRGQDRLPPAQASSLPGQEQVPEPQVPPRRPLYQQASHLSDHLLPNRRRSRPLPGHLQRASPLWSRGRPQKLWRRLLHRTPRRPSPPPEGWPRLCLRGQH